MTEITVTIKEIAEALRISERGARKKAISNSWTYREEILATGARRRIYRLFDLPKDVRGAILACWRSQCSRADAPYAPTPADITGRDLGDMSEAERRRTDAKLEILAALDRWRREHPETPKYDGFVAFSVLYRARKLDVPDWVYDVRPKISKNTLAKYLSLREKGRLRGLAGQYGNRKNSGVFDRCPDLARLVVGAINANPLITADQVRAAALAAFGDTITVMHPGSGEWRDAPLPSLRSFQRYISEWKQENRALHTAITDPDGYKNKYRYAVGRMYGGIDRRNQLWEIDASPADVLCLDGRYTLYVILDIYCRWPKVRVTKTPASQAALLLIRDAILDWGFPEVLKTDNGSDFTSRHFQDTVRRLGIEQEVCPPYTPEAKGAVERMIGTIQSGFMTMMPGFIGHSVADRKQIEARRAFAQRLGQTADQAFCVQLTADDLQRRLNEWIDQVYVQRPHDGLAGRTPFAVRAAYRGRVSRLDDGATGALEHLLLAPPNSPTRVVTKRGISVDNIDYVVPDGDLMPGETIHVRLDPDDVGRIYVYRADPWSFVGVGLNPERTGISRADAAARVKARQAAVIAEGKKRIRDDARQINLASVADDMARRGREHSATLVAFPERTESHSTPALEAAAEAASVDRPPAAVVRSADFEDAHRRVEERMRAAQRSAESASNEERWWSRAQDIERRLAAGEPVSDQDHAWLNVNRAESWYRIRKRQEERQAAAAG